MGESVSCQGNQMYFFIFYFKVYRTPFLWFMCQMLLNNKVNLRKQTEFIKKKQKKE